MPDSREELEKELKAAEGWIVEMNRRKADVLAKLGRPASEGQASAGNEGRDEVDRDADLFQSMTSSERMELYRTNPERHKRLLSAVETQGLRKLFGGKR